MSAIDRIEAFGARHERALSIAAQAWFWLTVAVYARFIVLPAIPLLTDAIAIYFSAAVNALWWGFLRPRIVERRKRRQGVETKEGAEHGRA